MSSKRASLCERELRKWGPSGYVDPATRKVTLNAEETLRAALERYPQYISADDKMHTPASLMITAALTLDRMYDDMRAEIARVYAEAERATETR